MNYYDKNIILIKSTDLNSLPVKIEFDEPIFYMIGTQGKDLILEKIILGDDVIYPDTLSTEVPKIGIYTINND